MFFKKSFSDYNLYFICSRLQPVECCFWVHLLAPNMAPKKSSAEAMRRLRERIKGDPEAHNAYLMKERERYQRRKAAGKMKKIQDLCERDQRNLCRKWRKDKRSQRKNVKKQEEILEQLKTPPSTPEQADQHIERPPSRQQSVGRKKIRRENRTAYRTIGKQKITIQRLSNKNRSLRRQIARCTENTDSTSVQKQNDDCSSLATKDHQMLIDSNNAERIRKELTFGLVLGKELKEKLKTNSKTENIDKVEKEITEKQLKPIQGTMKIHQLIAPTCGELHHRELSCFCSETSDAIHVLLP